MQTDWLLVRRLAVELDERLRGGRIAAVGLLPDGRFALDVRGGRAGRARLIVDAFSPTPLAWLASETTAALDLRAAPGWSRAFAETLEGRRIERIRGRTGDRLIAIDARARSRFGVDSDVRLVLELAPKFGNLVMLKDQTIVAAAREFEPSQSTAAHGRTTIAGGTYEPPPLPAPREDAGAEKTSFDAYVAAAARSREPLSSAPELEKADAALVRALRRDRSFLTPLVASGLAIEALRTPWSDGAMLREGLAARADAVLAAVETPGPVDVYRRRDGGGLVQAHLLPLAPFDRDPSLVHAPASEVSSLFTELSERAVAPVARDSFDRRRAQLTQRLDRRRKSVASSLAAAHAERVDDGEADRLRLAGEALFTHHGQIEPGATSYRVPETDASIALDPALDARANATAIFKRYRKLANRRVHAERRFGELATDLERLDELAWELARAEPETLPELTRAIDELVPKGTPREAPSRGRKAKTPSGKPASLRPHRIDLGEGVRLLVGRSPLGNAEVTFRLARPDDWWFHARGVPGAHVVLQLDESREPTEAEFERAAEAAAAYSSASEADRVEVDLTRRKYVRKRDTGPGQVWYVNARTIVVKRALA